MSLSSPIIGVLAYFQPLFTAPTEKKVVILLIGMLLARGCRHGPTALLQMGHQMDVQFSLCASGAQPRLLVVVGSEPTPVASCGQHFCHCCWEHGDHH